MNKNKEGIYGFFDEYYFLSNFYPCDIVYEDNNNKVVFKSSEAMFQAFKCPERIKEFENLLPKEAKALGRRVKLRDNWEQSKETFMMYCLRSKFDQHEELKEKLLQTGDLYLAEENTWGDKYWGTVKGEGKNKLGNLLMQLRFIYQQEKLSNL